MSSGGIVARKPVQSRESAFATMRTTLADFCRLNADWEREVESLFDDFETIAVQTVFEAATTSEHWHIQSAEQLGTLAQQQHALAEQQNSSVSELTNMRRLIEQQMELMHALSEQSAQLCSRSSNENWPAQSTEQLGALAAHQSALVEQQKSWQTGSAEQLGMLTVQQEKLAERQQSSASELTDVRRLVERQMELMTELSDQSARAQSASSNENWPAQSVEQLGAIATRQEALAKEQQSSVSELMNVRRLVEQQLESLTAFSDLSERIRAMSTDGTWQKESTEQIRVLVTQYKVLANQQQSSASELTNVRQLVEKQMELIAEYSDVSERICALSTNESWQANSEEQLDALAMRQEAFAELQKSNASELTNVRQMVERQMELLTAFSDVSERIRAFATREDWHAKSAEQLGAIAVQQEALAGQQQSSMAELASVRKIVEQQMELMMAYFDVSERTNAVSSADSKDYGIAAKRDPVVEAVKAQFEKLQPH